MFIPLKKAVKGFWDRHENQVNGFLTVKDIALLSVRPLIFCLAKFKKGLALMNLFAPVITQKQVR